MRCINSRICRTLSVKGAGSEELTTRGSRLSPLPSLPAPSGQCSVLGQHGPRCYWRGWLRNETLQCTELLLMLGSESPVSPAQSAAAGHRGGLWGSCCPPGSEGTRTGPRTEPRCSRMQPNWYPCWQCLNSQPRHRHQPWPLAGFGAG